MQRPSWRRPVRWSFVALVVLIGLGAAIAGAWWTTVGMVFLVAAQLTGIAHERRKDVQRDRR